MRTLVNEEVNSISGGSDWSDGTEILPIDPVVIPDLCSVAVLAAATATGVVGGALIGASTGGLAGAAVGAVIGGTAGAVGAAVGCGVTLVMP
jgi:hypothetical protein